MAGHLNCLLLQSRQLIIVFTLSCVGEGVAKDKLMFLRLLIMFFTRNFVVILMLSAAALLLFTFTQQPGKIFTLHPFSDLENRVKMKLKAYVLTKSYGSDLAFGPLLFLHK